MLQVKESEPEDDGETVGVWLALRVPAADTEEVSLSVRLDEPLQRQGPTAIKRRSKQILSHKHSFTSLSIDCKTPMAL